MPCGAAFDSWRENVGLILAVRRLARRMKNREIAGAFSAWVDFHQREQVHHDAHRAHSGYHSDDVLTSASRSASGTSG